MTKPHVSLVGVALALAASADAFWRLPCQSRSGLGRIDPIVDPGKPAAHVHAIHGGNNFDFTSTAADLLKSTCTSCEVTQDHSAYWHPALYFIHADTGKAELVWEEGGMLAYYLLYPNPGEQITAFPNGFQMISGDTNRRNFTCAVPEPPKSNWGPSETTQDALAQKALGFNCLNYFDASKTEPSLYRHYLPTKEFMDENCLSGVRFELMFPSCWNGHDLDSANHRSHVAFPNQVMTGTCPDGFPVRLPSLFFETIWRTDLFKGMDGEFVISNGDPTGYGYHGDFIAAWDGDVLQQAVDTCTNPSGQVQDCPVFNLQSLADQQACTFENPVAIIGENNSFPYAGTAQTGLLGPNPIQSGPAPASHGAPSAAPTYASSSDSSVDNFPSVVLKSTPPAHLVSIAAAVDPAPTSAPVPTITSMPTSSAVSAQDCWSTTTMIKDNIMWEVCVDREMVTVTATETPAANHKHKRHLHEHQRRGNF